ncbi:MAG: radical SAM protein [Candidatus Latescibacterota bacterium]|nr:MAG: radical SAM protein [Candidatus Latescibacterota bacterium]
MSNPRTIAADGTVRELHYAETPRFIQIETNLACNAKCPFCPYAHMDRGPMLMEDWVWQKIVDDTRDLGVTYRPFLINEPLSEKRLPRIVDYIKRDTTAHVEINTNGGLLTEKRARALLDAGIDVVRFSIDGFSRETYEPARPGVDYDKVVEYTNQFIALRDAGGYGCHIEVRMIDMQENKHEQAAFLEYWRARADAAILVPLYQWPWSGQTAPALKPCLKILDEIFFYTDGTAPLCCWDDSGRGLVGDVTRQSVLEIWNGAEMQAMRQLLNRGRRDLITLCSRCDAYKDIRFVGFEEEPASAPQSGAAPDPAR